MCVSARACECDSRMNTQIIGFGTTVVNDRGSDIGQLSEVSA